jgi:hypothetical protein
MILRKRLELVTRTTDVPTNVHIEDVRYVYRSIHGPSQCQQPYPFPWAINSDRMVIYVRTHRNLATYRHLRCQTANDRPSSSTISPPPSIEEWEGHGNAPLAPTMLRTLHNPEPSAEPRDHGAFASGNLCVSSHTLLRVY